MKKLGKNLCEEKFTVESMSCAMECNCSCTVVGCGCTDYSNYYVPSYAPTTNAKSATSPYSSTDFDLEWTIQALA